MAVHRAAGADDNKDDNVELSLRITRANLDDVRDLIEITRSELRQKEKKNDVKIAFAGGYVDAVEDLALLSTIDIKSITLTIGEVTIQLGVNGASVRGPFDIARNIRDRWLPTVVVSRSRLYRLTIRLGPVAIVAMVFGVPLASTAIGGFPISYAFDPSLFVGFGLLSIIVFISVLAIDMKRNDDQAKTGNCTIIQRDREALRASTELTRRDKLTLSLSSIALIVSVAAVIVSIIKND